MTYDPNAWNWQDTVAMVLMWVVLPAFLWAVKRRSDRRWRMLHYRYLIEEQRAFEKFFAERKHR
jgi:hypothetical protein